MKRENVFESDSPTLEMETQTLRPLQQGQQFHFANGTPVNPYQGVAGNPLTAQYQQQAGFPNNGNPQQMIPNQFIPQNPGFVQQQPYPYPTNYFQPVYGNMAPGYFPNAIPAPFALPYNGYAPTYPAPLAQPFNNQFAQPLQPQFAGVPTPQTNFGNPLQPTPAYQPAINIADGNYTMLPNQYTSGATKNGSASLKNGERDFISWFPNVNILETDRTFKIEICVPGVTRENCRLSIDKNNILQVTGSRRWNQETDAVGFTRKDFNYGSFACSFVLTDILLKEKITSSCRNGLLIISIPKREQIETEDRTFSEISVN